MVIEIAASDVVEDEDIVVPTDEFGEDVIIPELDEEVIPSVDEEGLDVE